MFGAAKGVPVNPFHFRNPRKGMMLTSIAGPATNVVLAVLLALAFCLTAPLALILQRKREMTALVHMRHKDATVFYNAGHIGPRHRAVADAYATTA